MEKRELLELLAEIEDDGNVDEILKDTDLYKSALEFENIKPLFAIVSNCSLIELIELLNCFFSAVVKPPVIFLSPKYIAI